MLLVWIFMEGIFSKGVATSNSRAPFDKRLIMCRLLFGDCSKIWTFWKVCAKETAAKTYSINGGLLGFRLVTSWRLDSATISME